MTSVPRCTRRGFLLSLPALCAAATGGRNSLFALAPARYNDLSTDLPVIRWTDPEQTCTLPPANAKALARRNGYVVFASDASGRFEVYRLEPKKSEALQVTEAESLGPFTMLPDERGILYADGGTLLSAAFNSSRPRQIYSGNRITALNLSVDGLYAAVVEENTRLNLIEMRTGMAATLAEGMNIAEPVARPKRASVLYRMGGEVWLANYDGKQNYRLRVTAGEISHATWGPGGRSVLYLNVPGEGKLNSIREFVPDTNEDSRVADTTQFRSFDKNGDASMFVGASVSKASPYVLLLARLVKREFPLCEHRSASTPVFSPNSQEIFFTSELHGKPALYRMDVKQFVEMTGEEER